MIYVVFALFVLVVVLPFSAGAASVFLVLIGIALAVATGLTMISSRLISEPASFFAALRANLFGFALAGLASVLLLQAAKHAPFALLLGPIAAFLAAAWAIGHVLSLRFSYAAMICALNAIILFGLSKTAAFLHMARGVA